MYEIIYDFIDEAGNECLNLDEVFEGTWTELQEHIKAMRAKGCYNIVATDMRADGV